MDYRLGIPTKLAATGTFPRARVVAKFPDAVQTGAYL